MPCREDDRGNSSAQIRDGELRRAARRMIGPGIRRLVDSSDLVQDALGAEAERRGDEFSTPGSRRRWLLRVMRNVAARYGRRGGGVALTESALVRGHGSRLGPASRVAMAERDRRVRERVGELKERDRSVVLLRVVEDLPFAEIGERLGVSEGNARVLFHRSVARLRDQAERHGTADL